jgi:hypothetical protein
LLKRNSESSEGSNELRKLPLHVLPLLFVGAHCDLHGLFHPISWHTCQDRVPDRLTLPDLERNIQRAIRVVVAVRLGLALPKQARRSETCLEIDQRGPESPFGNSLTDNIDLNGAVAPVASKNHGTLVRWA